MQVILKGKKMSKSPEEIAQILMKIKDKSGKVAKLGKKILQTTKQTTKQKNATSEFITTTRKDGEGNRNVYDEDGKVIGTKTKNEPIKISKNKFVDNKKEFMDDEQNKKLKKYTVHTPRTRPLFNKVTVTCHICNRTEQVHPIHAAGEFYRCNRCVKRQTGH
jgi:hypothetical protein